MKVLPASPSDEAAPPVWENIKVDAFFFSSNTVWQRGSTLGTVERDWHHFWTLSGHRCNKQCMANDGNKPSMPVAAKKFKTVLFAVLVYFPLSIQPTNAGFAHRRDRKSQYALSEEKEAVYFLPGM